MSENETRNTKKNTERGADPLEARIDRATQHAAGLVSELRSWVDLKLKVFQADLMEEVEGKVKPVALDGVMFFVLGTGSLFGLVALALFLGTILGHAGWGFLIVMGLLWLIAAGVWAYKKSYKKNVLQKKNTVPLLDEAQNAVRNGSSGMLPEKTVEQMGRSI